MAEITKEYFDKSLKNLATKGDLDNLATKDDLVQLEQNLKNHVEKEIFNLAEVNAKSFERIERKLEQREERVDRLEHDVKMINQVLSTFKFIP
ncbi:MAG: hypothetical protein A2750_02850 [Candidatus Yanofskybacteria bacterium RIFCSPHIGHO2_01_FULL_45_42]|uniref:Uncharacterized protein n=3 Tax=Candidatus Yanofskyibacteriota TaxID=1752733 RepID=A0A1F8H2A1_9BACT|nr:MAG: hypothetical protein A2750_02850 [Candidatus Yanofskybacteria bacterium RIFCSPHIGHO2_01_FULL_45_42]OGN16461.1 MAG: hypothetical protein A3C81_00645 [Candidatus Yanofskybacteria bacterium RIFCSPHIGHO2_02_FULL_46_19]OGN27350.1 MAG: hypothetical protein A3B17_00085 [Candidatus Yanofskybacteria bacterium RIFCSPLOWO2_01_FULL_45_72]OGN31671.1 MAG: hypothetical protein A3J01_02110 [Candidatus Yanofskybacteria bacterium RIFCSPLOWO2_02_FULL_45_18]